MAKLPETISPEKVQSDLKTLKEYEVSTSEDRLEYDTMGRINDASEECGNFGE